MNIQYVLLKPGTILLTKGYGWCKKLWYKIRGKALPYNEATLFFEEAMLVNSNIKHTEATVLEPRKAYSNKETRNLSVLVTNGTQLCPSLSDNGPWLRVNEQNVGEFISIINLIRPNTIKTGSTLNSLLENEYYNARYLTKEQNWNEIVY